MDREDNLVEALDASADDYMTKPVGEAELIARVTAVSRRVSSVDTSKQMLEFAPFQFNQEGREVARCGTSITLTRKEFGLSLFFFQNTGRVLSCGHILQSVWGRSPDVNTRRVDTHISRLRSKLGLSPESGWRLSSICPHGYRLDRLSMSAAQQPPAPSAGLHGPRYGPNTVVRAERS